MKTLIPIYNEAIGAEKVNSVNARELWQYLKSKRQFADWIKNRIKKFGFVDGEDFILVSQKNETNNGYTKNYIITIDMAKELAMVENNDKGREARRYFIAVEKLMMDDSNLKELYGRIGGLVRANQNYREYILRLEEMLQTQQLPHYEEDYLREDMSLNQKINFLLDQTEEELKASTHSNNFFQNRANYWNNYVRVLRAGGSDLQRFTAQMIEENGTRRKEAEDKYYQLKHKWDSLHVNIDECCKKISVSIH